MNPIKLTCEKCHKTFTILHGNKVIHLCVNDERVIHGFRVTRLGAEHVLKKGESLCPEDFPNA